jgi:uncharacterized protein with PQ loop repeat
LVYIVNKPKQRYKTIQFRSIFHWHNFHCFLYVRCFRQVDSLSKSTEVACASILGATVLGLSDTMVLAWSSMGWCWFIGVVLFLVITLREARSADGDAVVIISVWLWQTSTTTWSIHASNTLLTNVSVTFKHTNGLSHTPTTVWAVFTLLHLIRYMCICIRRMQ